MTLEQLVAHLRALPVPKHIDVFCDGEHMGEIEIANGYVNLHPISYDPREHCEDCAFGCCCAPHGYTSHPLEAVPALHYPFPIGSDEAARFPFPPLVRRKCGTAGCIVASPHSTAACKTA